MMVAPRVGMKAALRAVTREVMKVRQTAEWMADLWDESLVE